MSIVLIAVTSFIVALSGALVPGPLLTITVGESVKRGGTAGPLIILGHALLEATIVLLIVFGLMPALTSDKAKMVVDIAGGAILMLMGMMLFRDGQRVHLELKKTERHTGIGPIASGIVGSLSNPYWVIWWLTIGLGYLVSSLKYGIAGVLAFFVGHISADLAWYSLISFAVSRGRKAIGDRGYRFMLSVCGAFLICFGISFVFGFHF
jgi:threonine/homoserine/homoserine lactone efflux protein